jgi:hypothetical protein
MRSLERRGAFTLVCMAVLPLVMWLASTITEPSPVAKRQGPGGGSCPFGYMED